MTRLNKCPLISVIIPVYNSGRFLPVIYNCLKNQSYKNLEIIFVDDGSIDDSSEIIESFKRNDDRITVYHKNNGGPGSARNYGLDRFNGDFVAFIDSDDEIDNDYFLSLLSSIYDADICVSNYIKTLNDYYPRFIKKEKIVSGKKAINYYFKKGSHTLMVVPWGKLFKGSFIKEYRFSDNLKAEDVDLSYKYFYEANKVVFIPKTIYKYKTIEGSDSSRITDKRIIDTLKVYEKRIDYFMKKNKRYYAISTALYLDLYYSFCFRYCDNHFVIDYLKNTPNKNRFKLFMFFYCPYLFLRALYKKIRCCLK